MKAVFFDADGVLYYRQHKRQHLRSFLEQHGFLLPEAETLWQATQDAHRMASCGVIEREALYEVILDACHVSDLALRREGVQALAADDAHITLYESVAETLPALKIRGFRLGIITNTVTPTAEKLRWFHECGLDIAWDAFANSREVGVCKPHPRIYGAALRQCAVAANEALFVGHSTSELAGAKAVGLVTVAVNADPDAEANYLISRFSDLLELPILQHE
jgi:HAD superfamily hydrolase (TIGR01509 family)